MPEPAPVSDADLLARLEADGLIRRTEGGLRSSPRWMGAMSRAALRLLRAKAPPPEDVRIPIAMVLLELYGASRPEAEISRMVELMLPIELRELAPPAPAQRPP